MIDTESVREKFNRTKNKVIVVFSHEPWWVEFWSGFAALFWAYVSVLSGEYIYYHPLFLELSIVASAKFWQMLALTLGISQLLLLIVNNYKLRWLMCFFASWFWALLTIAVINSEPHPPSLALYATYSCINLFSMIKLARSHV